MAYKVALSNVIEQYQWVDPAITDQSGYLVYIQATSPDGFLTSYLSTKLTVAGVATNSRLPENYFTYTPWRALSGLGVFTNDATVGHPHGWTNEYTALGGTNFPPGRTNWYTTDYGWDGLKAAVTNLKWTYARMGFATLVYPDTGIEWLWSQLPGYYQPTYYDGRWATNGGGWAAATAAASGSSISNQHGYLSIAGESTQGRKRTFGGTNYYWEAEWLHAASDYAYLEAASATSVQHTTWVYTHATNLPSGYAPFLGPTVDSRVFNGNAAGIGEGWSVWATWGPTTATNITNMIGSLPVSAVPAWCAEPPDVDRSYFEGWGCNDLIKLNEWDFLFE